MYALTAKAMQELDGITIKNGIPAMVLMENASKGVFRKIESLYPDHRTRILVAAGSGNNGGDAFCVARWLIHSGYSVEILFLGKVEQMSAEAKSQLQILKNIYPNNKVLKYVPDKYEIKDMDLIVDGLFGTGLNKPVKDDYMTFIDSINKSNAKILSIDIPSGLNGTTGEVLGIAVKADYTVTFAYRKMGQVLGDGPDYCGELSVIDIGIPYNIEEDSEGQAVVCDREFMQKGFENVLVKRPKKSFKGTYGTVGIIAGNTNMIGASILAAKAALRAGCGLVKILCPESTVTTFNISIPEAVLVPCKNDDLVNIKENLIPFIEESACVCIGPGFREDEIGSEILRIVLGSTARVVIDAGALNLMAKNMIDFTFRTCKCVVTPHVGELAKMIDKGNDVVMKDLLGNSENFANEYQVSLVLKSSTSVVIYRRKDGVLKRYINTLGNSGLATAGSGDVLSGIIASLVAQGNTLNNSLLYGVLMHANASDNYNNERKMIASDIIENI